MTGAQRHSGSLPIPRPVITPETEEFWAAAAKGRLVLPKCGECGWVIWYPRRYCSICGSRQVTWIESRGDGVIHTYTVVRKGQGDYAGIEAYVLAYVDLEEGPRVLTNVTGAEPADLHIGQRVELYFDQSEHEWMLPRWRVA